MRYASQFVPHGRVVFYGGVCAFRFLSNMTSCTFVLLTLGEEIKCF